LVQASFRHPIKWAAPDFYEPAALDKVRPAQTHRFQFSRSFSYQEMRRVFDVCHGCRRCFNLCQSFPTLFDMIDNSPSGELNSVDSSDFKKVQ
jgi:glycerol-3-phosphate dehydrogenase subunit C